MSVSQQTKTLYKTGPIKFSDLRKDFAKQTTGAIKSSDLYREVGVGVTDPIVPDADINESVPAVDSGNALNLSNFRGTVKEIILKQSGTDLNFYGDSADGWGANLDRNIRKILQVTGTVGSTDPASSSFNWNGDARNVEVDVSGIIDGSAGASGTLDATNGQDGGKSVELNANHKIRFVVQPNGKIRAGGGGGAAGKTGDPGLDGTDGAPGNPGDDGLDGPSGPHSAPGGPAGPGGTGGTLGAYGKSGTGGDGGDGGQGGDAGKGGDGGQGGETGGFGAQGDNGTDGAAGQCYQVEEKNVNGSCNEHERPGCPDGYYDDGTFNQTCGWIFSRPGRHCKIKVYSQVPGGYGGIGGPGGDGGDGGQGGKGGKGGNGGYGGAGGAGGSAGKGGKGGKGKGYLNSSNSFQAGTDGGKGNQGQSGGSFQQGSPGGQGGYGKYGDYGPIGQPGEPGTPCPGGYYTSKYASPGRTGGYGKRGEQGTSGTPGTAGQKGESGEGGKPGKDGNPGQDGGAGGDYGQDGQSTPWGTAGKGAAAIVGGGGQYHVILQPASSSYPAGVVAGAYDQTTTDVTSVSKTPFVKPQLPAATISSSSSALNEGSTMTFSVSTQNIPEGTTLYYTLSGFAVKDVDFQYNPSTDSTLSGAFTIASNAGTFDVVSVTDGLIEDNIEVLVSVRLDDTQGAILAYKIITLTANNT